MDTPDALVIKATDIDGGTSVLARQCRISCTSTSLQLLLAALFVLGSLWAASLLLEPFTVSGVTSVPPGVLYRAYDRQ